VSLNYHHLRYFWAIAHEASLTKAAARLHVAQSALSIQLRQLEESCGHALFTRKNRKMVLTEAGHVALRYADSIFRTGDELMDALKHGRQKARQILRIGAVATLSRNFQGEFLKPLRNRKDVEIVLRSGSMRELVLQLQNHSIDVMLSNQALRRDVEQNHHSYLLDDQPVSLVGRAVKGQGKFQFPEDLRTTPLLLPTLENELRAAFDVLLDQAGIRPVIAAEVDDMAMLRVLALRTKAVALVPRVVVQDELRSGMLVERYRLDSIHERFYAITPGRTFPNLIVGELIERAQARKK
jgi:LysR family transcriptional activator of nhaA